MSQPIPAPPSSAPPAARPQRVSVSEQQQAVSDMEAAAKDLEKVLADTESMGKERQLERFESGVRELNQLNALKRAETLQEQHQLAERRGSWNAALGNGQVQRRESLQQRGEEDEEEDDKNEMLGYYGGAAVTRGGSFAGRKSLITDGTETGVAPEPSEAQQQESFQRRTSITASMRIVGSLTPALLKARRASASSTGSGTGRRQSLSAGGNLPPVPGRRHSSQLQDLGVCQAADIGSDERARVPQTQRGERNSFAADTGGDESQFQVAVAERRPSTARRPSSARRRSSTSYQQDSSNTRVTGKIDYASLLNEQEEDMQARRASTEEYKTMLTQVEDYQKKMLDHLDSQLVFMGITDKDVEATAAQLSAEQKKAAGAEE
eukprot:Hpha_TRINITY_DN16001_c2_g1::TRINITY_DN16001_c2_g1_i1::g.121391::m.121391